jgi:hypothetical protein
MIESKTILVPTSLKDVKLHQMLAYQGLKEDMEDTQRQLEAVSIFCELTMTDVNRTTDIHAEVQNGWRGIWIHSKFG